MKHCFTHTYLRICAVASGGWGISVFLAIHFMEIFPSYGVFGKISIIFSIIGADQFPDAGRQSRSLARRGHE